MRGLSGKRLVDIDVGKIAALATSFRHVLVDVGAGDGGYVLHRARTEPNVFAIAIDASPDALRVAPGG